MWRLQSQRSGACRVTNENIYWCSHAGVAIFVDLVLNNVELVPSSHDVVSPIPHRSDLDAYRCTVSRREQVQSVWCTLQSTRLERHHDAESCMPHTVTANSLTTFLLRWNTYVTKSTTSASSASQPPHLPPVRTLSARVRSRRHHEGLPHQVRGPPVRVQLGSSNS